uniref:SMODS and SLOG-associating 2TM effector domain-containing protein n=2 Tax=Arion vulgaris TaxID=1028688 RepID=A0A0B6Z9G8_9EUPU
MENYLKRTPVVVSKNKNGELVEEEYDQYKLQTRGEYEELMIEFEFRCRRAAMMNYHIASNYDRKVYKMELVAALLGTVSLTTVGAWLLQQNTDFSFINLSKLGGFGIVGIVAAFFIELLGKGSTRVIPSFSRRAESHVTVGAAWQTLAKKTRSYRIQLDNPRLDVPVYAEWYNDLITQREKLCSQVCIPESIYQLYNDPNRVFHPLKERRQMFLQFMELEKMDSGDFMNTSGQNDEMA